MCVLQKCPHLEELILNQALRPRAWFRAPRPSSLPQASISELNPSFGLKKLSAFLTPSIPYLDIFLASCPRIESIRFSVSRVPLPESALAMLRAHVYQLKSIELVCPVPDSTSPSFILKALSKNPLHTIKVQSPNHDILHIIGRVYSLKVEHIVLSGLSTQATQDIIKILGNCQALRTLRVEMEGRKYVDVRALLGEPWVCQRLESLSMPLALIHRCRDDWLLSNARAEKAELDPECKLSEWLQTENVFMRRLGGLTQLRLLHLSSLNRGQAAKIASLSWRFEGGLHHLAGLTQLQVLHLGEGQLAQGRREVRWMRNHWRSLQRLVVHQLKHRHLFATQWPELTIETLQ
ncbi:hypothetical protein BGZ73_000114 [Actinomortierella ambigua]|nr:hypothetical protein BGZ73_000114 [Actinomortierella ambigua]